MKRFLNLFVLTQPEQRLIVILVLLLLAAAWFKHHRDLQNTIRLQPTPGASPEQTVAALQSRNMPVADENRR
jgi:hypothetical protein